MRKLLIAALVMLAAACQQAGATGGSKAYAGKVGQIRVGVTTKSQVLELFGSDPASMTITKEHPDLVGQLPATTPDGPIEWLIYTGSVDLGTGDVELLHVYIDSAGKVCHYSYD